MTTDGSSIVSKAFEDMAAIESAILPVVAIKTLLDGISSPSAPLNYMATLYNTSLSIVDTQLGIVGSALASFAGNKSTDVVFNIISQQTDGYANIIADGITAEISSSLGAFGQYVGLIKQMDMYMASIGIPRWMQEVNMMIYSLNNDFTDAYCMVSALLIDIRLKAAAASIGMDPTTYIYDSSSFYSSLPAETQKAIGNAMNWADEQINVASARLNNALESTITNINPYLDENYY